MVQGAAHARPSQKAAAPGHGRAGSQGRVGEEQATQRWQPARCGADSARAGTALVLCRQAMADLRAQRARTRRWLRARFWQAGRSPAGGAGGTATPQEDMPQRGCARRHSVAVHMRTAVPRWWAALWAAMKTALVRWARAVALGAAGRARLGWYGAGAPRSHQASVDGWADDGATGVVGAVGAACAVSASALCSAAGAAAGAGAGSCTGAV